MNLKQLLIISSLPVALFSISSQAAQQLPVFGGIKAGVTNIKYAGQDVTGYQWAINLGYRLNSYASVTSGYSQTTADVADPLGVDRKLTSSYIPVGLQFSVPIAVGAIYARAGANYYKNDFNGNSDTGFGVQGALGINLASIIQPGGNIEITYRNSGDAESSTVLVGADIGF